MAKKAAGGGILASRIKSANVKFFPEALLGYLAGPFFALIPNGIINVFLTQYWVNVLGLSVWANAFTWLLPLISSIFVVIGNILVGRLMEGKPRKAGKARPLMVLSVPAIIIALIALFLAPSPYNDQGVFNQDVTMWVLIIVAIGYNLFYAFAWPLYYTSHSAMVNLSTRNASQRSLLGTMSMAAQVGAAGVAGMAGGILADLLRLLPNAQNLAKFTNVVERFGGVDKIFENPDAKEKVLTAVGEQALLAARADANSRWMIIMIVLVVALFIGVALEFLFTRERITEEQFGVTADKTEDGKQAAPTAAKVKMSDQIKVCVHDKYWWIIILFFFLYQLGGMLKNNGQTFYSQAWTNGDTGLASLIGTLGAIPTAVGMVIVWPLANKFGKAVSIKWGALAAVVLGFVGWIPQFMGMTDVGLISTFSVLGFCLKALGTVPAMYVSLALMSDVLDHQEAVYGIRTDGFTMALYGSIMIAMTGISNAIILAIVSSQELGSAVNKFSTTMIFFGGEMVCYAIIFVILMFMNVEKFSDLDHAAIDANQRAAAEAAGIAFIPAKERLELEQKKAEEEARASSIEELRNKCEKSGADFNAALADFEAKEKAAAEASAAKKAAAKEKADAKAKAKADAEAARVAALTPEQKAAEEAKKAAKEAKAAEEAKQLAEIHARMVAEGHKLLAR
ncbi:MAG: MFS transporter [Bacilli bacterium]|nr:MFS transporter [Bacilli bacterium]